MTIGKPGRILCLWLPLTVGCVAEPSFAIKYKADCTLCHTVYPRLNRVGYEFRRLGYRFPGEVEQRQNQQMPTNLQVTSAATSAGSPAGAKLYRQLGCSSCHFLDGTGGRVGPVLNGVGTRRTAEYIAAQITHPRDHNSESLMPAFPLDAQKTGELVSYLESIPPGETAAQKWNPLDYLGFTWIPAIRLDQSDGNTDVNYDTRTMIVFLAGTLGDHLSMFVESNPADTDPGFASKWQTAQGLLNFGGSEDFLQLRFGQFLPLQGSGFGGTDRFFSDSTPLIYLPVNGFTAARLGRGGSAEYTLGMATTLKAYSLEEADGSRAFGGVFEQVIGKQGLSGISVQYAGGWNPNLGAPGREFHFQRWYFSGTKTFQNHSGRQVFDLIGAGSLGSDNQLLGSTSTARSTAYGSFIEADAFPILHYLTTYVRFDQLRPTTQTGNSVKAGTAGIIIDATRYTRFLFEYQRFASSTPANFFTIGFRVNL